MAWALNQMLFHTPVPGGLGQLYVNSVVNIAIWVFLITGAKMLLDKIRHEQQLGNAWKRSGWKANWHF